jgi:hypothetical protein
MAHPFQYFFRSINFSRTVFEFLNKIDTNFLKHLIILNSMDFFQGAEVEQPIVLICSTHIKMKHKILKRLKI